MAAVNKVILLGNVGADPEVRYMPNGDAVTNVRLATTESWKDKSSGEKREMTEWHRVVFYRKLAEIAGQYLKKGSQVFIEGRIRTRKWQDKDGQDRYTTEIEATEMQMLGSRGQGNADNGTAGNGNAAPHQGQQQRPQQQGQRQQSNQAPAYNAGGGFGPDDEDIPFGKLGTKATIHCL